MTGVACNPDGRATFLCHLVLETEMLLKAEGSDAGETAITRWRSMIPFWNTEADRFRAAAVAACREGRAPAGISEDIETVMDQIRAALRHCDALMAASLPGDHQLPLLLNAAAEFDALLESMHRSLERIESHLVCVPRARPLITIDRSDSIGVPRA